MTITDWIGFHEIPYWCEYPGCYKRVHTMTHNIDKIKGTHHQRYGSYWDYIYVCGYHFSKLLTRIHARWDAQFKDHLTPAVRKAFNKQLDPVTAWENYVNNEL